MFDWFQAREAKEFGIKLADLFTERVQAGTVHEANRKSSRKFDSALEKVYLRARQYRSEHRLNLYKRAKLMNAFQWRLIEHGHDKELAQRLARDLLRNLLEFRPHVAHGISGHTQGTRRPPPRIRSCPQRPGWGQDRKSPAFRTG